MIAEFKHYKSSKPIPNVWRNIVIKLVNERNNKQFSQEELADRIGVHSSLVHKWEQYKRVPSCFLLSCWVEALDCEIKIKSK